MDCNNRDTDKTAKWSDLGDIPTQLRTSKGIMGLSDRDPGVHHLETI